MWIIWQATQLSGTSLRPLTHDNFLDPLKLISTPNFLIFGYTTNLFFNGLALFLTLSMGLVFLLEYRKVWRSSAGKDLLLGLLPALITIGGPLSLYFVRPFFLPERTMAAASPFLLILMAWGLSRRNSPLPFLVWVSVGLMAVSSLSYHLSQPLKPPYRDVTAFVNQNALPQDTIVHTSDGSYLPALRYGASGRHHLLTGDPDPRLSLPAYTRFGTSFQSIAQIEQTGGHLWLIVALEHSYAWQEAQVRHFMQYPLLNQYNFEGIQVYHFNLTQTAP
jgi:hypothetical protein